MSTKKPSNVNEDALFDADWYTSRYPDVAMTGLDPRDHYNRYGVMFKRQPSPSFSAKIYADHHQLADDANPVDHFQAHFADRPLRTAKPKFTVADLQTKLWSGFAGQTEKLLEAAVVDNSRSDKERAAACFTLARWNSLRGDYEESLYFLKMIRKFDVKLFRSRRVKLMIIDTLIEKGDFSAAEEMIDFVLQKGADGDFLCAKSNLLLARDGVASAEARIDSLNRIYTSAGLDPISLINPDLGLTFGNIAYANRPTHDPSAPLVSVLVPVYNAGTFLDVAIRSLLGQSWPNLEIICVEDRSTDDSWSQLQQLAAEDDRLKIYQNDVNMGAYPTRNRALSLAQGQYITVHDSDDWSHHQMIEMQMKALLDAPEAKASCSFMTRALPSLRFNLRPQRERLEYVHRSYPSLLISRASLEELGEWDGVFANADDELIQRMYTLWGKECIIDAYPSIPFSFFLVHENSLTQQKGTSLNSLTFGIRREYARQAAYWRAKRLEDGNISDMALQRTSMKSPFPIPQGLAPRHWEKNWKYDVILISDLSLLGGTRRCNEAYIKAAIADGKRVGLFHWPRYDLKIVEIAKEYLELTYHDKVDIIVPEDTVDANLVLIHHPPILNYRIDRVPTINAKQVAVLANQSPMQRWSEVPFYYDALDVEQTCIELFGQRPTWIPISQRVKNLMAMMPGFHKVHNEIWSPPYQSDVPPKAELPVDFGGDRPVQLGRHSRDHWTKWPAAAQDVRLAYCADVKEVDVSFLGGIRSVRDRLADVPANWTIHEFDTKPVSGFLKSLDFFVHYTHEDYIEEFGRNVMEAMAASRVVILPPSFKDIFGRSAIYVPAHDVTRIIWRLWDDPAEYLKQAQRGLEFVRSNCSADVVAARLSDLTEYGS